jgi:hypothetical protein
MPRILRRLIEIAIAIVVLLDLFTPATGGFADIYGLPYLLIPPLFAAFYSLNIGLISLLIMTAVLAVPVALFLPLSPMPMRYPDYSRHIEYPIP